MYSSDEKKQKTLEFNIQLKGKTILEAEQLLPEMEINVLSIDGKGLQQIYDWRSNRINVCIANGAINKVDHIG